MLKNNTSTETKLRQSHRERNMGMTAAREVYGKEGPLYSIYASVGRVRSDGDIEEEEEEAEEEETAATSKHVSIHRVSQRRQEYTIMETFVNPAVSGSACILFNERSEDGSTVPTNGAVRLSLAGINEYAPCITHCKYSYFSR